MVLTAQDQAVEVAQMAHQELKWLAKVPQASS
jgi:hypothetical protein